MGVEWGLGHHSFPPSFPRVQDLNSSQLVGRSHSRDSSVAGAKGSGIWFFKAPGGRIVSNPGSNLETITLSHFHTHSRAQDLMGALCCHLVGTQALAQELGLDAHL